MPTVKLGLPTITDNAVNDVPLHLNSLAESIDDAAGETGGLALHDDLAAKETPAGAQLKIDHASYKVARTNKDAEGVFTTVEYRRKSDNTLAARSVLSGGTSPQYTTRTVTFYAANGTTVVRTDTFTITYDVDGEWVGEA